MTAADFATLVHALLVFVLGVKQALRIGWKWGVTKRCGGGLRGYTKVYVCGQIYCIRRIYDHDHIHEKRSDHYGR